MPGKKTAVFLMNLGGPRNLEEVEPYLLQLFSDPLVVSAPFGPFRPLFARLVSHFRAPSSAEKYQLIGGRSPLVEGTEAQGRALQALLGEDFTVHLAMRYGHPDTSEGVRDALAAGAEQAVSLPLYPQWANATSLSSLVELRRRWPREKPLAELCTWHDHPGYLDASAAALREVLAGIPPELRGKLLVIGRMSRSALLPSPASNFPRGRWTLIHFPSPPARSAAYLQQQDEASLTAFSTASRVSPVRF
jgi:ferrochelatase